MAQPIDIEHPDDPRIEPYRRVRDRDVAGRDGGFIAEGEVVLRTLARAGRHPLVSVLLAQKRVAGLADLIAALPANVGVYAASQAVMDAVVGFPIHRGILAYGRHAPLQPDALIAGLGERALVVGLVGVANHDNMGGVLRNAAAFGADAVLLDPTCCDPLYRKAIRVSVGAALTVPFARLEANPATWLGARGFEVLALTPEGETPLRVVRAAPRTALLLGAEGPGLPAPVLAAARTVSIPMASGFDSLNLATTSGIALHQLRFGG